MFSRLICYNLQVLIVFLSMTEGESITIPFQISGHSSLENSVIKCVCLFVCFCFNMEYI